jgi:hypothetical protein
MALAWGSIHCEALYVGRGEVCLSTPYAAYNQKELITGPAACLWITCSDCLCLVMEASSSPSSELLEANRRLYELREKLIADSSKQSVVSSQQSAIGRLPPAFGHRPTTANGRRSGGAC